MVSIIIPTYNRAHLIERSIKSILNQTISNWELIIVDDGSTDNTKNVIGRYLTDLRIKYYGKNNSGAAESRNIGVLHSTYHYVTFLDSDDEAEPIWLEKMTRTAVTYDADIVCCGLTQFNGDGQLIGTQMPYDLGPIFGNVTGRFTNGGVFLLRREIFLDVGGFDAELRSGQHTELALRLMSYFGDRKLRVSNLFEPLIRIHIHGGPRIRHNYEALYLGSVRILEKHAERLRLDKPVYALFLSIAGVTAIRTKRYKEAKGHFWKALEASSYRPLSWVRWIVSNIPIVRDRLWKKDLQY